MGRPPAAIPILISIIALNFTIVFGSEAWRILASPIAGLDRGVFAHLVYGIGSMAGFTPATTVILAVAFGVVNLATAILFALHLGSRLAAMRGGKVSHELLDAALVLVVVSTIVAATPAILNGATDILIHERLPLWLVGLAATLSMVERLPDEQARAGFCERLLLRWRKQRVSARPIVRAGKPALRWNQLRSEAGLVAEPYRAGSWFKLR